MALTSKNTLNFTVQYILKSGLILDEDMDCILAHFNADDENFTERKLSFIEKLLSGCSMTGLIFMFQLDYSMLYKSIAAAPLFVVAIQRLRESIYSKNRKRNLEILIKALRDISKMNRMISEYYSFRNSPNSLTASIINPYTKGMKLLIEMIFHEEINLLYAFRGFVWQFGEYVPSLRIDYEYLENIVFEQFTMNNINSINDCVIFLQRLCDIFVLVVSSTLTCLAVTLCPKLSIMNNVNVNEVLDTIVPRMKNMSVNCYNKINKKFDDIRYHHLNKTQIQKQSKPPAPNSTSKLYLSTSKVLASSSDLLEKSQQMLEALKKNNLQTLEEKVELSVCIGDLRTHAFDFYQSLDVLHQLFEININHIKPSHEFKSEISSTSSRDSISAEYRVDDASLYPSEPTDDEEYELYIGANETPPERISQGFQNELESRQFASLLGQELKQKLKTHAKFIAARKKRGITDEEPQAVKEPEPERAQEQPPEFQKARLFVTPPPPPPLPPVMMGPDGDMAVSSYAVNNFLDSIKAASNNHKCKEEFFESSDIDGI